jgi:hypothetical protein
MNAAGQLVKAYLAAMEARDLALAKTFLAPGFVMIFPGGHVFTQLEEVVARSKPRYRFVKKAYERFDEVPGEGGGVVYCFGTLYGEWPDGVPFSGIRFIDRFTVRDGRLIDQKVWNDLAEVRPKPALSQNPGQTTAS